MTSLNLNDHPHRRLNALTGEWILVSPHRDKRPWKGQTERRVEEQLPSRDPGCYLCPGTVRANGEQNPDYSSVFVFTNDYSALLPGIAADVTQKDDLLVARGEPGKCRVVCFSPRHDLTLPELELGQIRGVVDAWAREYTSLGAEESIHHVQIFENKGQVMGCSNPHPHGQIWAQDSIPTEPAKELIQMKSYLLSKHSCLLCDYLALEKREGERIICENGSFVALVPFWAVWPFETMVLPRRHCLSLDQLTESERDDFSDILKRITSRYDNLFEISFPYSSGIHQAPTDGQPHEEVHLHMHFYPPLLRSATVKKFMVGYEMLANPQRDITAESAAARIRECSERHYKTGGR
jgi:UDPglucose--hexose-1-phosphate uridylyltransferase